MRQPVSHIRTIGRVTQGVKLVKLDDGSKISSISRVINEEAPRGNNDKTEAAHEGKSEEVPIIENKADAEKKIDTDEA
jgi:DNA gyrase subunit A